MLKRELVAAVMVTMMAATPAAFAANHREAPITALDRLADITDYFSFVSYDDPTKVTFILDVDPLLDPANGPNYFPFDPNILYEIKIDNDNDADADIIFQFRFQTEIRPPATLPANIAAGIYTTPIGITPLIPGSTTGRSSITGPNPGTPIVPLPVTALDGPGSEGITIRQTYTVTMLVDNEQGGYTTTQLGGNQKLFALPSNNGPRTIPNFPALASQAIYNLGNGIRVFAGTVDDPFYIDLGAAFDTLNLRAAGIVLGPATDADDHTNLNSDNVSGYNVNSLAIEVPITMVTRTHNLEPATSKAATIGSWGTTSRPMTTIRNSPNPATYSGPYRQVQRMGNPLINELYVGNGSKDFFSMSQPMNDVQFANFFADPYYPREINATVPVVLIPNPPRLDLAPLFLYLPPIAAPGTPTGPIADLLRLNTGVPPTPLALRTRLGLVGSAGGLRKDPAGWPNGRRISDDVLDLFTRIAVGVWNPAFANPINLTLGDGVNTNDVPEFETFPYLGLSQSGRNSRHLDPGELGCSMGLGAPCTPPDNQP